MSLVGIWAYPLVFGTTQPTASLDALPPKVAQRLHAGRFGDDQALAQYVRRARRMSRLALSAGAISLVLASLHIGYWLVPATLSLLGSIFDALRGRLGVTLELHGNTLLVRDGSSIRRPLGPCDVEAIGFGAPGRGGFGAPETFWRGDFTSEGNSHLLVLRLCLASTGARRLIVPESSVEAARAAVTRLRRWKSSGPDAAPD